MPEALSYFDCNARIGRTMTYREGQITTADELLAEMDYAGIHRALVHHAWASQWSPAEGNAELLGQIAGQERLFPCLVALPEATGELAPPDEFAQQVRELHGAVRLFPRDHQFRLADWCMASMLCALEARGVPVLVDINQTDWAEVAAVLAAHPNLPLIVLDTYYRMDRYLYPLWERHPTLYAETTTYQVYRGIEAVCARFGHERLLFGTNLPSLEVGGPISQLMYAELSFEAKQAIAGGTLCRLLGL